MKRTVIKGIPVSPGIALGPGFVSSTDTIKIPVYRLTKKRVASEIERFHKAIEVSRAQLMDLQKEVEE